MDGNKSDVYDKPPEQDFTLFIGLFAWLIYTLKGIGGGEINNFFYNLILFYRVLTKLWDTFYRF